MIFAFESLFCCTFEKSDLQLLVGRLGIHGSALWRFVTFIQLDHGVVLCRYIAGDSFWNIFMGKKAAHDRLYRVHC
jgi:hypothetical protein